MPITELALLRLLVPLSNATLLPNLSTALHAMANFTSPTLSLTQGSLGFHYYHSLTSPSHIYLLGSWSSVTQHMETWIPSAQNQELLELLKGQVEVEWMFHVDVEPSTLPLGKRVLEIERFFVEEGNKVGSEKMRRKLNEGVGKGGMVRGGWRIEKGMAEGEGEEYVLFTGWESVDRYQESVRSKRATAYEGIKDTVTGIDSDYAVRLEMD